MAFEKAAWRPASVHEVFAAFLRAESHRFEAKEEREAYDAMMEEPIDFADGYANHVRMRLLFCKRLPIVLEIPPDTEWFEVSHLADTDLDSLWSIGAVGWVDPERKDAKNELRRVAARKSAAGELEPLRTQPATWANTIVWGHGKGGPLTILEGNHRYAHLALAGVKPDLHKVFVGLSPTPCFWHAPDLQAGLITGRISPLG